MDSTRSRGRNKLFPCFRPAVADDCSAKEYNVGDGSTDPVVMYLGGGGGGEGKNGKGCVVIPKILNSLSDEKTNVPSDENFGGGRYLKKRSRRLVSRVMKALFFEASMKRQIRRTRSLRNIFRSTSGLSLKRGKASKPANEKTSSKASSDGYGSMRANSTGTSLFSSSTNTGTSISASSSLDLRPISERKSASFQANSIEFQQKQTRRRNSTMSIQRCLPISTTGLGYLLLCLLVLILWGKICAIFCMSAGLFVCPRRITAGNIGSTVNESYLLDTNSEKYKKKVIMEGLIERNRNRNRNRNENLNRCYRPSLGSFQTEEEGVQPN